MTPEISAAPQKQRSRQEASMHQFHSIDRRFARRSFLNVCAALAGGALVAGTGRLRAEPASAGPADPALIEDLVAANHILFDQGVVDGYGHVSVRHDKDPSRYLLSRSLAPELVTADDIVEFDLDSNPVDARGRKFYLERFIHGEIYKARPEVKSVVHHHSPAVIPFGVTKVPLRAVFHMAAFVGEGVPVFEIRDFGGMTNMLVSNSQLGAALARTLGDKPAVLMRGHGAVVVGASVHQSVARSVYLQLDARLQAQAMALGGDITYLAPEEARKFEELGGTGYERAWDLWKRKVMAEKR
jgi:ribulose-5-phosphate 4-epimerase/fuculose-1-phosphate aldolase